MRLTPTAEQQEIKDAVRRFAAAQITPERLAAWEQSPHGIDAQTWRQTAELGWLSLGLPTSAGGSGRGLIEVACLLEECGRGLVAAPVINAICAAVALATLDPQAPELPALGNGDGVLALAFDEQYSRDAVRFATCVGADGTISGEKYYVSDAARATFHMVAARDGDGLALLLVDASSVRSEPLRTFDGDRQAIVTYERTPIRRHLVAPSDGAACLQRLRRQRVALELAEMVGGMDAALTMTVDYVKQREQFGQKLAVFQAVQHQIADMAMAYTAGRHLAWQAITRLALQTDQSCELATAAAFVGQAYKRLTLAAHHLHGGAGYVIEHPLRRYAERAQALCIRYAPEGPALAEVAASLLDS